MAAITINTNINAVLNSLASRMGQLKDRNYLLRPVAIETIANMKQRIHKDGEATDSSQIGTYSSGYLAERQRKYKRSSDPKIIVALTSQLENDWSVIATDKGYGIGFNNPFNFQKLKWVELNKRKVIGNLTTKEQEYVTERLNELTKNALNP